MVMKGMRWSSRGTTVAGGVLGAIYDVAEMLYDGVDNSSWRNYLFIVLFALLMGLPPLILHMTSSTGEEPAPAPRDTSPTSEDVREARREDVRKARFKESVADFETRLEARRVEKAEAASAELVSRDGGTLIGSVGSLRVERDGRRGGAAADGVPRRGVLHFRSFKLTGVWLSDFVDGGDGASGDGAQERRCLDGLVGQAADANLAEDQATLEAAILAIATSSGDTSAAMLLKVYRYKMS